MNSATDFSTPSRRPIRSSAQGTPLTEQPDPPHDEDQSDDAAAIELAQPFVGQWNELISTTNWDKGRIISEWRVALIESVADKAGGEAL